MIMLHVIVTNITTIKMITKWNKAVWLVQLVKKLLQLGKKL